MRSFTATLTSPARALAIMPSPPVDRPYARHLHGGIPQPRPRYPSCPGYPRQMPRPAVAEARRRNALLSTTAKRHNWAMDPQPDQRGQDDDVRPSDLSEAERLLWAAFPHGQWVDLREGRPLADDVGNAHRWGRYRDVRAEVVRALLLGACAAEPGHVPAVRLRGCEGGGPAGFDGCDGGQRFGMRVLLL